MFYYNSTYSQFEKNKMNPGIILTKKNFLLQNIDKIVLQGDPKQKLIFQADRTWP